jgi:hypothetical protein
MTRDGDSIDIVVPHHGEPEVMTEPGQGYVPNCLRRAFGLPSVGEPMRNVEWFALQWLGNLAAASEEGRRLTWPEAVGQHPAMQLLSQSAETRGVEFATALRAFHNVATWGELRTLCIEGRLDWVGVAPRVAAWMDDRFFALAATEGLVSLPVLWRRTRRLLDPEVAAAVRRTLRDCGVYVPTNSRASSRMRL